MYYCLETLNEVSLCPDPKTLCDYSTPVMFPHGRLTPANAGH